MFIRSAWDWGLEKSTCDVCICVLSVLMTGYRPDTRKSERSKLEHYCIFFYALLLCIICAHITIHKFISWLVANINHRRSLFCCFQRFDLTETQDADWTCTTAVYLKFLDWLLCILSTPHCWELMELMMGNHSCGGSHGRACNMLFMMKIDDDTHKSYDRHSFWQNGLPSKFLCHLIDTLQNTFMEILDKKWKVWHLSVFQFKFVSVICFLRLWILIRCTWTPFVEGTPLLTLCTRFLIKFDFSLVNKEKIPLKFQHSESSKRHHSESCKWGAFP